jgi:hypothetical protein
LWSGAQAQLSGTDGGIQHEAELSSTISAARRQELQYEPILLAPTRPQSKSRVDAVRFI